MAYPKSSLYLLTFAFCVILPSLSFSEIKITLKNERTIIADECQETGEKLVCTMMGGSFEIEKKDIVSLKEVTIIRQEPLPETYIRQEEPAETQKVESPRESQQSELPPVQMQEPGESSSPDAPTERRRP